METSAAIKDQAEKLSTDEWIDLIGSSLLERRFLGDLPLPGAPRAALQVAFVGGSSQDAMREAACSIDTSLTSPAVSWHGHRAAPRLWLSLGPAHSASRPRRPRRRTLGADPDPLAIQVCRLHVPFGCFVRSTTRPPLPFRDQFFDVVIAYSVFSHLSEINAANSIYELSRTLKPGGLLVATTHGVWALDLVKRLQDGVEPCASKWHERMRDSWPDVAAARACHEAAASCLRRLASTLRETATETLWSPSATYARRGARSWSPWSTCRPGATGSGGLRPAETVLTHSGLIAPHGGALVDPMAAPDRAAELRAGRETGRPGTSRPVRPATSSCS